MFGIAERAILAASIQGATTPLTAPDFSSFTLDIPDVEQGTVIMIPITNSGGAVDTYTVNNLSGASVVNDVLTYTASTLNTYNNVSVYGENAAGNDTTNTDSFTVSAGAFLQRVYNDYQGYKNVAATSMNLVLDAHKTTTSGPCTLQCSIANSTFTGTTLTGAPITPAMAEARWRLTDSNGDVVTDWMNNGKGRFLPTSGKYINNMTDQVSPLVSFPIYDPNPETYTATVVARLPDGAGGFIVETASIDFTVTAGFAGFDHYFMNKVTGDDANTGHDPFGSAYTGGTYDNSTGILTATGAFATAFANQIAQSSTVSPTHLQELLYQPFIPP